MIDCPEQRLWKRREWLADTAAEHLGLPHVALGRRVVPVAGRRLDVPDLQGSRTRERMPSERRQHAGQGCGTVLGGSRRRLEGPLRTRGGQTAGAPLPLELPYGQINTPPAGGLIGGGRS